MKKVTLNEHAAPSGGCNCGHVAENHAHGRDSSTEGGCCNEAADGAEHKHANGCCGERQVPEAHRSRDADKDKGPHP